MGVASLLQPSSTAYLVSTIFSRSPEDGLTKVSNYICLSGIRRPFPVDDVSIVLDNQAILLIAPTKFLQTTFGLVNCLYPLLSMTVTASQGIFERRKPRIELNNTWSRERNSQLTFLGISPVPSAATLSLAGSERTELSDALFKAEAAMIVVLFFHQFFQSVLGQAGKVQVHMMWKEV